jgi:hypothetical protein
MSSPEVGGGRVPAGKGGGQVVEVQVVAGEPGDVVGGQQVELRSRLVVAAGLAQQDG